MKLACVSSLLILSASWPLCAQQASAPPQAQGREVTLMVGVRDKHGALVSNLSPADLTLSMDGRAQTIRSLTNQSTLPFRVGLLVDTGRGLSGALDAERKAAASFVDAMLPADSQRDDRIFLIHFDRQVELLRDFTSVRAKLHSELDAMSATRGGERRGPGNGEEDRGKGGEETPGRGGMNRGEGAQLYDAIFLACDELMKTQTGRKALVLFSGGVDSESKETLNDAIDAADRVGLEIYAIYLKPEEQRGGGAGGQQGGGNRRGGVSWPGSGGGWPGSGGGSPQGGGRRGGEEKNKVDGKKILEKIATRTGGRFYEAKKKENLEEIYKQIADELRGRSVLTFVPDKDGSDGQYHKFEVKAKKDGLSVSAREGYYAEEK